MSKRLHQLWRKVVASTVACTLAFAPIVPSAYAASTDISDIPLVVKNQVPPNIMMTLDDSGSMQWEFLPEDTMVLGYFMFPPPPNPYIASRYADLAPNFEENNSHNYYSRSAANNKAFYDPTIRYRPWSFNPLTGVDYPNATPSAALYNPAFPAAGSLNLTSQRTQTTLWFSDLGTQSTTAFCQPASCNGAYSYWPITYYNYIGPANALPDSVQRRIRANYTRIQITNPAAGTTYPKAAGRSDCTGAVCTTTEEIQNFANWFTYYRSRINIARAGIGRAFATLGLAPRVGFGAINRSSGTIDGVSSPGTVVRGVRPFTGTDRTNFFSSLYNHPIASDGTPLRRAMDDVGRYFERNDNTGPWGANPGVGGGVQLTCRQNFNIMMTDGYWNIGQGEADTNAARQNVDGTNGPSYNGTDASGGAITGGYVASTPWSDSYSNTLADVAMYYYKRDLRPDMVNNVLTSAIQPAFWQHMRVYGVALGVFGTVTQAAITNALTNPGATTITWPDPTATNQARIDDLAHAGVNTRGGFFSASNPDQLADSLGQALDNIVASTSAGSAVGINTANIVSGDNRLYAATYFPGFTWTGEVAAHTIDINTGVSSTTPLWTARDQLTANKTSANRKIATYTGSAGTGQGIRFQPPSAGGTSKMTGAQLNLLNTPLVVPGDGAAVLEYIRGNRAGEGSTYRTRTHLLGDMINAQPVVVRKPEAGFTDPFYSTYRTANASRQQIVLQGANDGILHAFHADTGEELWGYVPSLVLPNLNNLSRIQGYAHRSYVDATPVVEDVNFDMTQPTLTQTNGWQTIAVGGLGKGGRGYYALNVTTTTAATEFDVASKVMWEFPNDSAGHIGVKPNIGWTYGKPIVTKTKAAGWVVIVPSGYNNGTNAGDSGGNGQGYLFVLNARSGDLIRAIPTGVGSVGTPSGLAHIAGYADNANLSNEVKYIYGGDLLGNIWRFDLTSAVSPASWTVSKVATLVDAAGNPQPVTSEPELGRVSVSGVFKPMIFVGTGRYLGDSDLPGFPGSPNPPQTQTMYGLIDDLSAPVAPNAVIQPLRSNLVQQSFSAAGGGNRTATRNNALFPPNKGWYIDMPDVGERIITRPSLGVGTIVFSSTVPSDNLCELGGYSYLNALDYLSGGRRPEQAAGTVVSTRINHGILSAPVLVRLVNDSIVALTQGSDTFRSTTGVPGAAGTATTKRRSWRELLQ